MSSAHKVLIIAYYFPPLGLSGVQRILKFTKYLPEFDWQPVVLTCGNTSYYAYDESQLQELDGRNIPIYRTPDKNKSGRRRAYPGRFLQKFGRLALQTFLLPDSRRRWKKPALAAAARILDDHPDIDLIFATAPPFTDFLIAAELSRKYDIPFVADYRDLWTDNPQYFFPTPLHKYIHQLMEANILRACRKVVVITRTMKDKLLRRYKFLSYQDVTVIPHGYDGADFRGAVAGDVNTKPKDKKLRLTHSGLFPDSRTPKYLLKSVAKFLQSKPEARSKIELHFVGLMRKQHISLIKRYKLMSNTVLHGYLPHGDTVKQLQAADILWMMLDNNIETPGKLFEYIGSGKPLLLCIPPGELRQIANEYRAAFCTAPKDTKQITATLHKIYAEWQAGQLPKGNKAYIDTFDRRQLTALLSKELAFAALDNE